MNLFNFVVVLLAGTSLSQVTAQRSRLRGSQKPFVLRLWKEHAKQDTAEKTKQLADHGGGYFVGAIYLGKPEPQEMHVAFSTSTGMVVLPSTDCKDEACKSHQRYNPEISGSSIDIQQTGLPVDPSGGRRAPPGIARDTTSLGYAASNSDNVGGVEGNLVSEMICFAERIGNASEPMCATVGVAVATEMKDKMFRSGPQDGMVGMALSALAISPVFHFISRLDTNGLQPHFGFWVADDAAHAELTLGGHDQDRLESGLEWVPVARADLGHWLVDIVAISVGGEKLPICEAVGACRGLVHTSSPKIVAPEDMRNSIISKLNQGKGSMGCQYPDLTFHLKGGVTLDLRAEDFVGPGCAPELIVHHLGKDAAGDAELIFLGEPVLRRYYTVFDWVKESVAFARVRVTRSCRRLARAGLPMPSHCEAELTDL